MLVARADIGVMLTPDIGNVAPLHRMFWAADTGCFASGNTFTIERYFAWLTKSIQFRSTCLFATAPDVVGDAEATHERSKNVLPELRRQGWIAALVAQDGIERLTIDWSSFDALFIGGTTKWKLSEPVYELIGTAVARKKWVHVGRVNSLKRLQAMHMAGAHSADGTFLKFGPDVNLPRLVSWLTMLDLQTSMTTTGGST